MGSATVATQDKILTTLFPSRLAEFGYQRSKLYGLINKSTNFYGGRGGAAKVTTVNIAPTSGGSAQFSDAQANQGPTQEVAFNIAHKTEYQVFSIQGQLLRIAKDKGAIIEPLKLQMGRSLYNFWRAIAIGLWGNAGGSRGVIASGQTTTTVKLSSDADISRFERRMWVQFSDDDGSGSSPVGLRSSGQAVQIQDVKMDSYELVFSAALDTLITDIEAGDYIFRAGDYTNRFNGIPAWHPVTAPTTSFLGVDRSVAPELLSGHRVPSSGGTKEETLIDAATAADFFGIQGLTHCFANPKDIGGLFKSLASQVLTIKTDMPTVSYEGIKILTGQGPVILMSETDVPKGYFWMLNPKNYHLRSAGPLGQVLDQDGNRMLRHSNDDAYEWRIGADLELDVDDPHQCIIGTW